MSTKKFCVIGLGHFGLNLAKILSTAGAEVLAIDNHQEKIDLIADKVTHAVCMDSTDKKTLQSLGLNDMDAVIIAIGEGFESSLMTTAIVQEFGIKKMYARVTSPVHERLLRLMNITDLLVPEADAAAQFASRLLIPGVIGSFSISKDFGIFEIKAPKIFINKTILEIDLRKKYLINLVTIKRIKKSRGLLTLAEHEEVDVMGVPKPDLIILENDILVLFGKEKDVSKLLEV